MHIRCWNCDEDYEVEDETKECPECGDPVVSVGAAQALGQSMAKDTM